MNIKSEVRIAVCKHITLCITAVLVHGNFDGGDDAWFPSKAPSIKEGGLMMMDIFNILFGEVQIEARCVHRLMIKGKKSRGHYQSFTT